MQGEITIRLDSQGQAKVETNLTPANAVLLLSKVLANLVATQGIDPPQRVVVPQPIMR